MSRTGRLSVVIPVLEEAGRLPALLADLALAPPGLLREVWVVDGGSRDGSARLASLAGARLLHGPANRGAQLALGASRSDGTWLLLLHADVRLPRHWWSLVDEAMQQGGAQAWAFPLAILDSGPGLALVALLTNLRCRLRQLPYGDQGLLLRRSDYELCGGVAPLPLMEDLDLVLRLRRRLRIRLLGQPLRVDGRRWRRLGILATAWSHARLRRAWRRGADPAELARRYRGQPGRRETTVAALNPASQALHPAHD